MLKRFFSSRSRKVANDSKVIPKQQQQPSRFSSVKVHPSNSARRKSPIAVHSIPTVPTVPERLRESDTIKFRELLTKIESRKSNQSRNSIFELSIDDITSIDTFNILNSDENPSSLILKPNNPITDTNYIYRLLKRIEQMDALEELEFSNFEIDVSDFLKSSGGIPFEVLFSSITKLTNLKRITFDNVFDDAVKRNEYQDFHAKYFSKDGGIPLTDLERISLIVEWMIKNTGHQYFDFNGYNAYKMYLSSNTFNKYLKQKQLKEGTQLPDKYVERHLILKARAESSKASHIAYSNDMMFESFLVFLQDDEAVKKWLKWLILNNTDTRAEGDIVERLRIVIEYFKYNIYVITFLFENPTLQKVIISEFNKIWHIYQYRQGDINKHYNRIIKDIIGDKLKSRGGRKSPKKPSKQPNVALKEHKKPPKQPNVSLNAPKKQPNVALKAPTVARKTNKNK
jgi:hypothetical protein